MNHLGFLGEITSSGGDWVIYLLVASSIIAVTVIIERLLVIHRHTRGQGETFERVATAVRSHASKGLPIVEQQLQSRLAIERNALEKRLLILGTLGNNAPFIGLLGTVLGVIRAFHDLGAASGQGPEVVMQGLAEALVSTAVGILVALPCVAAYNYLQKWINDLMLEADRHGRSVIAAVAES